jgi:preprotein translocase subunit SecY
VEPAADAVILIMMVAVVAFIVLVERGERRIPVQYAKRVVGRRVMGGQSTHMPLKVNAGGVIPVIFASSILAFPQTLAPGAVGQEHALAEQHAGLHPARRAALLRAVRGGHHFLLFLLRIDHFQPQ